MGEPQLCGMGLPTSLKRGVITLLSEHTVCRKGDKLTSEQARILKLLDHKQAEFKVDLIALWSKDPSGTPHSGCSERRRRPAATVKMKRMKGCQMMMRMPAVRMIERKPKGTFDICLFETSLQTTRPSLIFRCNSFSSKLLHYVFILTFFIKFNYKCHIFQ